MANYTVKQGDCLSSITSRFGFASWRTIYDHPNNVEFKRKRPNPDLIYPGDILYIPDKEAKTVSCPTGKMYMFQVPASKPRLRLVLVDLCDRPFRGVAFTLSVGDTIIKGTTKADGLIEQSLPPEATQGTLMLDDHELTTSLLFGYLDPLETPSGVQARLKNLGYDCGPIDGIVGPKTRAAIYAFQRDNPPLVVDGSCGPKTRAVLLDRYGC